MAVHARYLASAQLTLAVQMLVAVDEETRLTTFDVGGESTKALVGFVLASIVVNAPGRVVGDKHVHRRKGAQGGFYFVLFVEMMPPRLVTLAPAEPAETQATEVVYAMVQINDGRRENRCCVVVAFDSEDHLRRASLGNRKNEAVRQITAGNQHIDLLIRENKRGVFIVRNDQAFHDVA